MSKSKEKSKASDEERDQTMRSRAYGYAAFKISAWASHIPNLKADNQDLHELELNELRREMVNLSQRLYREQDNDASG